MNSLPQINTKFRDANFWPALRKRISTQGPSRLRLVRWALLRYYADMGKKKTIHNPCHICWASGKNKPGMDRAGRVCAIGLAFGFGFYFFRAEAEPAMIVIFLTVICAAIDSFVSSRQKRPACRGTGTLKSIEITEDEE